jgi:hypothetical protein
MNRLIILFNIRGVIHKLYEKKDKSKSILFDNSWFKFVDRNNNRLYPAYNYHCFFLKVGPVEEYTKYLSILLL